MCVYTPPPPPALLDEDDWLVPPLEAALSEVFCRFDADVDGAWSTAELQSFARTCNGGEEFGEAELSQVGEFTTDGQGRLTRRGFLEMMHLQTMARPEDTWADLRALGYDSALSPKGVPGSSGAEAVSSEKPELVAAEREGRSRIRICTTCIHTLTLHSHRGRLLGPYLPHISP